MGKLNLHSWKKSTKIAAIVLAAIIGLFIAGILFFAFMPGYGIYIVKSGSMVPAIHIGDVVITGPIGGVGSSEIAPGKVITFQDKDILVTHRILSIDGEKITTKGDANKSPDSTTITTADVKGMYMFKIPYIGYITQLTHSRQGWFLVVIVPTIILVLMIVKDILKEAFKKESTVLTNNKGVLPDEKK